MSLPMSLSTLHSRARWFDHPLALRPGSVLRSWLADPGSMTFKLRARCQELRVQRLRQCTGNALADECDLLQLTPRVPVQERDVILHCDGRPVLFGHTVAALSALPAWPFFGRLGERPLGASLFADPLVQRGAIQFARLYAGHPLLRRLCAGLAPAQVAEVQAALPLYARRSLFRRQGRLLLVTDVFLPALSTLMAVNIDES